MKPREWFPVIPLFLLAMLGSASQSLGGSWRFSLGRVLPSLYYLPVASAALRFGPRTACGVAIAAGACYAVTSAAGGGDPWWQVLTETLLFISVALVTGTLAESQPGTPSDAHGTPPSETGRDLERTFRQVRLQDITPLVQMEVELVRQFLTPVASIEGASWMLEEARLPEEKNREFVTIIQKEAKRLDRSLSNLLNFVQPRKPRYRDVNLGLLLDEVIKLVKPVERGPYFLFRTDVPPELPLVRCDPDQIKYMLVAVLTNSIEATPGGGEVGIVVHASREDVAVQITDRGKGIKPEILDRVFDPFFSTRDNNLGLGLTVASRIAAAHGGGIAIESTSCNGTSISLKLPLKERAAGSERS